MRKAMPKKKVKKKKKRNGHRIGGAFENKIKKLLLDAFAPFGIGPTDAFRSVMSGGHKDSCGDISLSPALCKLVPYAIECKNWSRIDLYQLLVPWKKMGKVNKFKEWWKQTLEGAEKSNGALHPLLVFRSKGQPIMCMLYSHHFCSVLNQKNNYFRKHKLSVVRVHHPEGELFCFKFDVLLQLLIKRAKKGIKNGTQVSSA
jgi:hypothetical protein